MQLSVLLPNYNHAATLPRALDALLAQSRPADEVLLIDDGSTDGSVAVMERYSAQHPAVKVLRHERNRGVAAAVNTGLAAARGRWVYGAGADDAVRPGFFERAMELAKRHRDAGAIFGQVLCRYSDHRRPETQRIERWAGRSGLVEPAEYLEHLREAGAGFSLGAATIFRREALLSVGGFRPELGSWMDTFAARTLTLRHGGIYLDEPCVDWTVCGNSYSHATATGDPLRMKQIGDAAAALMRDGFAGVYPEGFIERWRERWELEMAGGFERLRGEALPHRLRDVRRAYAELGREGSALDRVLSAALRCTFWFLDRRRERQAAGADVEDAGGAQAAGQRVVDEVRLPRAPAGEAG